MPNHDARYDYTSNELSKAEKDLILHGVSKYGDDYETIRERMLPKRSVDEIREFISARAAETAAPLALRLPQAPPLIGAVPASSDLSLLPQPLHAQSRAPRAIELRTGSDVLAAQAARDAASTSTTWPVPRQPRTDVAADRQGEANAFAPPDDAPQRATVTGGQVVVMSDSDESDGDDVRAELAAAPAVRASSAAGSAPCADSADVRTESLAAGAGHGDVGGATAVGPGGSAGFSAHI